MQSMLSVFESAKICFRFAACLGAWLALLVHWDSFGAFASEFELELELIQTQITQKLMIRAEVYARIS